MSSSITVVRMEKKTSRDYFAGRSRQPGWHTLERNRDASYEMRFVSVHQVSRDYYVFS